MNRTLPTSLLGLLALSLAVLFSSGCSGDDTEVAAYGAFDAERYRGKIESVEAVLYKDSPADYGDLERVTALLLDLHESVLSREKDPRHRDKAHGLLFVTSQAGFTDAGYATADLGPLRSEWEGVRHQLFGYADWFRQTTSEVRKSQERPAPTLDRNQVKNLTRVVEKLEDLIEDGRGECDVLGEPCYQPSRVGREGERQISDWNRFARSWDDRVTRATRSLPPQPPLDGVIDYVMAYQSTSSALNELRMVAFGAGEWPTPFRYQWEQRFNSASSHLSEARTNLERLP